MKVTHLAVLVPSRLSSVQFNSATPLQTVAYTMSKQLNTSNILNVCISSPKQTSLIKLSFKQDKIV